MMQRLGYLPPDCGLSVPIAETDALSAGRTVALASSGYAEQVR
jgi:hypothetical protein